MNAYIDRVLRTIALMASLALYVNAQTPQKTDEYYQVIQIDRDRVYINAGSEQGAYIGMIISLYEPIKWQDKKGKIIEDFIPFAYASLKHVGNQFSIFTVDSMTLRLLQKGSAVKLGPTTPKQFVEQPRVETPQKQEASKLDQPLKPEPAAKKDEKTGKTETKKEETQLTYSISEFRFGEPLYFQLYVPVSIQKPEVRVRRQGEIPYTVVSLRSDEPSLYIGRVDKDFHLDKDVEYYIKGVGANNEEFLLAGNPARPLIAAAPPRKEAESKGKLEEFVPVKLGFLHTPPEGAVLYKKLPITVYAPPPMRSPRLRYRVKGRVEYKDILLTAKPNDFYYFEIPEEDVAEPAVQYYLTVAKPSGEELLVLGNPENPQSVNVSGFAFDASIELKKYGGNRSKLRAMGEYVGFRGKDYYQHYEVDYMYRIFSFLYSITMGMSSFEGQGGVARESSTVKLKFYHGYVESEVKVPTFGASLIGKFLTGINDQGIGSGFEGKVRVGEELGINLVTGFWTASRLGTSATVQLNVPLTDESGFSGLIGVEDLPVRGETGFRMAIDYRQRVFSDLDMSARLGMGARDTKEIGYNLGVGFIKHF